MRNFRAALTNGKLAGVSVMIVKGVILKNKNKKGSLFHSF